MAQKHVLITRINTPGTAKVFSSKRADVAEDKEEVVEEPIPVPKAVVPKPRPKKVSGRTKPKPKSLPKSSPSTVRKDVTVVITNFKTKALLKKAHSTFRKVYPKVRIIIVDNGSADGSTGLVRRLGSRPNNTAMFYDRNIGHGPAMHKAIQKVDTPYVFTLDTDTETIKGGFLERMVRKMRADKRLYALGWRRQVDKISGVPLHWHAKHPPSKRFTAYVHPSAALYRVSLYHTLAPFFHHGAPCLSNMREATRRKLKVEPFPIRDYVKHLKAGTRRMYKGRWDPKTSTPRGPWKEKDNYAI